MKSVKNCGYALYCFYDVVENLLLLLLESGLEAYSMGL